NIVRAGEWPIWQRGMFMGYPVLGDIQFQIFNPLTWMTLPLEAARGITVQSLAELCICAVGMAYWMKQRGLQPLQGVFAGVALAAPLLLPVAEMSALGPRGAGVTYKFAASWSWPDRSVWASMLLPRAWGGRSEFRGPMNYWELQGYFGLLPMVLLVAAPVRK